MDIQRLPLALHLAEPSEAILGRFHALRAEREAAALEKVVRSAGRRVRPMLARLRRILESDGPEHEWQRARGLGLELIDWNDPRYPSALRDLPGPPAVLYKRGAGEWTLPHAVTVVGARRCSGVGRRFAHEIGEGLAARGATVISGLAIGIDQAVHEGVLAGGGTGVGILSCGLEQVYPPGAEELATSLMKQGSLLSEMPIGTPPLRRHFPRRNRILAALGRAVIVVEADQRSGSLITVHRALDLGREVWAVPGDVDKPSSRGSNELLRDGATPLIDLSDLDPLFPAGVGSSLGGHEDDNWLRHLERPCSLDQLAEASGVDPNVLSVRLIDLESEGRVLALGGGLYRRARG